MTSLLSPITVSLRSHRERLGLSQAQLADRAGVRQATISDIESGKTTRIDLRVLDALCEALGVTPGELLEREVPSRRHRAS